MSKRPLWYATRDSDGMETPDQRAREDAEEVWTVGPSPDRENWRTDSGCPGYGMSKADAERVAALWNANLDVEFP